VSGALDNKHESPTHDEIARGLFFIVGTGRCGTTLLQAMLASHPRIAIPPETHFFDRIDPLKLGFGDAVSEQRIDRYVRRVTSHARWHEFGISSDEFASAIRDGNRDARSIFLWIMQRLIGDGAGPRLGEKTPRHAMRILRIRELFPDAKIIHIHRDPRDVVHSMKSQLWAFGQSTYHCARRCQEVFAELDRQQQTLDEYAMLTVRYEDLAASPETELRRVCAFLGEPFDDAMLRYHEREGDGFFEREQAWKSLTREPIDPSRIGRYRSQLSEYEIWVIENVVGEHLAALGYEAEPGISRRWSWACRAQIERHAATLRNSLRFAFEKFSSRRG